ncbi:MAG: hypothetical protein Q8R28_18075 [Dehalococcoidia bacterium]|nr:hypothetical protein [Dehalococcoidia bacterium]
MVTSEVSEGLSADVGRRIAPTYGYYRQANGWVKPATNTRLERLKYIEHGWEYLGQYGAFDMSPYMASHPLDALFMFGGAKELPVDQIIEMGFHLNPPQVPTCRMHITQFHRRHSADCFRGAAPVVFPQLADVAPERLRGHSCEFCPRVMPTAQGLFQHQQVAHSKELNNMQAGKSLATALGQGQAQPQGLSEVDRLRAENEALKALLPRPETEGAQAPRQARRPAARSGEKPKRVATPAQREALAKARANRKPAEG